MVELSRLVLENGLMGDYDDRRQTFEVDPEELERVLPREGTEREVILVGHLSHLMPVDKAVILRCRPSFLAGRLRARGYPEHKVIENMEAEACDVILIEALDEVREVYEVDGSHLTPEGSADAVEEILGGKTEKYGPGHIDWSEEVMGWF